MARIGWIASLAGLALAGLAIAFAVKQASPTEPIEPGIMIVPGAPVAARPPAPRPLADPLPAPTEAEDWRDPPAPRDPNSPNYADLGVLPAI
jgi:hypothetical protein